MLGKVDFFKWDKSGMIFELIPEIEDEDDRDADVGGNHAAPVDLAAREGGVVLTDDDNRAEDQSKIDAKWEAGMANMSAATLKLIFGQMSADNDLFKTAAASDSNFAAELGSIDFAKIIGGPLDACVKALQKSLQQNTILF